MFSSVLGWVVLGLLILAVGLWIVNKKYPQTLFGVAQAKLGDAAREMEARNALSLMQQANDNDAESIKAARNGGAKLKATIEGLKRQIADGEKKIERITTKIRKGQENGLPDTDPNQIQHANNLKYTRQQLAANQAQLDQSASAFDTFMKQMKAAMKRVDERTQQAERLNLALDMSKITVEINQTITDFGGKLSDNGKFDKYADLVQKQIDQNNATVAVNNDLSSSLPSDEDDTSDAKDILAELRKPAQ